MARAVMDGVSPVGMCCTATCENEAVDGDEPAQLLTGDLGGRLQYSCIRDRGGATRHWTTPPYVCYAGQAKAAVVSWPSARPRRVASSSAEPFSSDGENVARLDRSGDPQRQPNVEVGEYVTVRDLSGACEGCVTAPSLLRSSCWTATTPQGAGLVGQFEALAQCAEETSDIEALAASIVQAEQAGVDTASIEGAGRRLQALQDEAQKKAEEERQRQDAEEALKTQHKQRVLRLWQPRSLTPSKLALLPKLSRRHGRDYRH